VGLHEFESVRKPKQQPARPEGLAGGDRVWGEVRRPGMGYRVQLSWDGRRLAGRLGGAIFGENVYLEAFAGQLLGSVASSGRVLTLHAQLEGRRLQLRLVGPDPGARAVLELDGDRALGTLELGGQAHTLEMGCSATQVRARIGEQEVLLHHPGFPAWVLAVAALTADVAARNAWRVLLDSYTGWAEA